MENNWLKKIQDRTQRVPTVSGRSEKSAKNYFDDLVFMPAQLTKRPIDYFREKISSKTIIGKSSRKPIEIETPIIIGAMSFGALSREAKTALAKASTLAGTFENTGEGGVLPEEREFAKHLIIQYSTGRFGLDEEILKKADAIEIKIGQGAKGGQGGLLPAAKVTEEIAAIRRVEKNKDVHSPPYHPDISSPADLKNKVDWLKKITDGAPLIIKLAAGNVEEDLEIALQANPDIVAIDGLEGGTGAAPEVMSSEMGLPAIAALARARAFLDKKGAKQELWIGGGFSSGSDFAKALALGADAIFAGTALLGALGCNYCRLCYLGKCPKGITTQDPNLRKLLDVEAAAGRAANFIRNCTEEIKMLAGACAENDVHNLNKNLLRSLTSETAKIANVKFIAER